MVLPPAFVFRLVSAVHVFQTTSRILMPGNVLESRSRGKFRSVDANHALVVCENAVSLPISIRDALSCHIGFASDANPIGKSPRLETACSKPELISFAEMLLPRDYHIGINALKNGGFLYIPRKPNSIFRFSPSIFLMTTLIMSPIFIPPQTTAAPISLFWRERKPVTSSLSSTRTPN